MEATTKPFKATAVRARARRIAKARRRRIREDAAALSKRIARRVALTSLLITLAGGLLMCCTYIGCQVYVQSKLTKLCEVAGPALDLKTDWVSVEKINLRQGTGICYYTNGILEARIDSVTIGWKAKGGKWRWEDGYRTLGGEWHIWSTKSGGDEKALNKGSGKDDGFNAEPAPPLPREAKPADRVKDAQEYTVGEREARAMAELADGVQAPVPVVATILQWLH